MCSTSFLTFGTKPNEDMVVPAEEDENVSKLLEQAADNNIKAFKSALNNDQTFLSGVGSWYCRQKGTKQIARDLRTPLMVAATYGSLDVLQFILSHDAVEVNFSCGRDNITALHCAASGGSSEAASVFKILLSRGADPNRLDRHGFRAVDLIVVHPKVSSIRGALECLLADGISPEDTSLGFPLPEYGSLPITEKKEYPIDPSLPDITNSIYSTDEFRMYSFKVRPCSRAYSHDWTECPFVHPGENARRRDPRKYHYSCVPCPEFRKGTCRRNDMCEYAHGVFECWLHPAQYRTRLCKDGTTCNRRVCFFAHAPDELRPLYVSTGSAVPSPRSTASIMDMAAALSRSPSMSPPTNMLWPQASVPTLHLPGSGNLQSSRLRASVNARDFLADDLLRRGKALTPSNLEDLFVGEVSSPRFVEQGMFSPKFGHPSPINTPKSMDQQPLLFLSPRGMDPISPMGRLREKHFQQMSCMSPREKEIGQSPWQKWGSPGGQVDWGTGEDAVGRGTHAHNDEGGEEPDVSWVQSLVKESPEMAETKVRSGEMESVIESWLEQMQMDKQQVVA